VYSSAIRADGTILLGVPGYPGGSTPTGRVSTATTTAAADGSVKFVLTPGPTGTPGDHFGISVAAGNITGLAGGDFVVLSDSTVQLLSPSGAAPLLLDCPSVALKAPPPGGNYGFRPIAVGNLLGDSGSGDEIVLGGQVSNQGMVVFGQYDPLKGTLSCPKVFAGGVSAGFGTSLAIADFDGDGHLDLAVGAPPDRVLIYFGPLDSVTDPQVTISSATATGFGNRIAPLQVGTTGSAQLMVADSGARGNKGEIRIFSVTRTATSAIATLFDANQDSDSGGLGQSLGTLPFEGGLCPPTTGSKLRAVPFAAVGPKLLTFFAYSGGSQDPRCFAQAK
jgi:FG-GAP repeat